MFEAFHPTLVKKKIVRIERRKKSGDRKKPSSDWWKKDQWESIVCVQLLSCTRILFVGRCGAHFPSLSIVDFWALAQILDCWVSNCWVSQEFICDLNPLKNEVKWQVRGLPWTTALSVCSIERALLDTSFIYLFFFFFVEENAVSTINLNYSICMKIFTWKNCIKKLLFKTKKIFWKKVLFLEKKCFWKKI